MKPNPARAPGSCSPARTLSNWCMGAVTVNWTLHGGRFWGSQRTSLSHFSFLLRHSRHDVIMRFRLRMRACLVAADTAGDLGLDSFSRSQPSSEKPISMLGIVLAGLGFLRPLKAAAKNSRTGGGARGRYAQCKEQSLRRRRLQPTCLQSRCLQGIR